MSATPIRALIASSRCGSATPGGPVDRQRDALGTPGGQPGCDRLRVEAELRGHVAGELRLRVERLEQRRIGDEGVALRIGRDPDLAQRMADLGHRPEERQAVRVVARLLRVATDDEGAVHAGALEPGDQLARDGCGRGSSAPTGAEPRGSRAPGAARTSATVASIPLAGEAVTDTVAPAGRKSAWSSAFLNGTSSKVGARRTRAALPTGPASARIGGEEHEPQTSSPASRPCAGR